MSFSKKMYRKKVILNQEKPSKVRGSLNKGHPCKMKKTVPKTDRRAWGKEKQKRGKKGGGRVGKTTKGGPEQILQNRSRDAGFKTN